VGEVEGPVGGIVTHPTYLDVRLDPGGSHVAEVPPTHQGFVYVYAGRGEIAGQALEAGTLGVLGPGDLFRAEAGPDGLRFLIVAARPLGEPIARYGPFVMNTESEIQTAFEDYRRGRF